MVFLDILLNTCSLFMKNILLIAFFLLLLAGCKQMDSDSANFIIEDYGIQPDTDKDIAPAIVQLIKDLQARTNEDSLTITFPKGRYNFYPDSAFTRTYYISNHDQDNLRSVAFAVEDIQNVTIDGQGSEFIFHGRMIPFAIRNSRNIQLKNFSVDFELPALRQIEIKEVDKNQNELIAEIYPEGHYHVDNGALIIDGEGYSIKPINSMAFRADKRLTYQRADVEFNPKNVEEVSPNLLKINGWDQVQETRPGERYVLRSYYRPTPGIFIDQSTDTRLKNVAVHYAEGMGLLAQMSKNITLEQFSVALRGENDPRYFTTQADATHFSGVKGKIISKNGLYEGMADDAINVHGTYLKIHKRVNDSILQADYMHPQTYGFTWGEVGDTVQFVESSRMELIDYSTNTIKSIKPVNKETIDGAKRFEITFDKALPEEISEKGKYAVENLTWTPEVVFSGNTIRNNRARGTLFSTPKSVLVEDNFFDHTHGAAILLAGDANGWYETGMTHDVLIRNNRFLNALTANYQFTNAIISIHPEIPDLEDQKEFFHTHTRIEDNEFETFDHPILYAKSVDTLIFKNNTIKHNEEFEPLHWNRHPFFFEKVDHVLIEGNSFDNGFDPNKDVLIKLSDEDAIKTEGN